MTIRELSRCARQKCIEQAEQGKKMKKVIDAVKPQMLKHARWFYENDEVWDTISAACDEDEFDALATNLHLNSRTHKAITIFLAGLSTHTTDDKTWELVTCAATGDVLRRLKEIYAAERRINAEICEMVSSAGIYLRGTSIIEAIYMYDEVEDRFHYYPFVSMTIVPWQAKRFAVSQDNERTGNRVVMVLDASLLRKLGAEPAKYSMAAGCIQDGIKREYMDQGGQEMDAHDLQERMANNWTPKAREMLRAGLQRERVERLARFHAAAEMQAHIDGKWPPRSYETLLGIWPIGGPSTRVSDGIRHIGVPEVSLDRI